MENGIPAQAEAVLAIVAGPSGIGKTTDALLAFPCALCFCAPGAMKPAVQFFGAPVSKDQTVHVKTIREVVSTLAQMHSAGTLARFGAVIIDDLSLLAEGSHKALAESYSKSKTFQMWADLKNELIDLREWLRYTGLHAACNAHLAPPETDMNGVFHKGGPDMPSKKMRASLPHIADLVLVAEARADQKPWGAVYRCDAPNPQWHVKDRHGVASGLMPMNLGEILRAAGYAVPRLPGLEWIDGLSDSVSQRLARGDDKHTVWTETWAALAAQGVFSGHIYMTLRDGFDRHTIKVKKQNGLKSLYNCTTAVLGAK